MKYWKTAETERGYSGVQGITLRINDRILSISEDQSGRIVFTEECDGNFKQAYTKTEAILLLQEAIEYIHSTFL